MAVYSKTKSACGMCRHFICNGQCKKGNERAWFDNEACDDYQRKVKTCKYCIATPAKGYGGLCKACYMKLKMVRNMQAALKKEQEKGA